MAEKRKRNFEEDSWKQREYEYFRFFVLFLRKERYYFVIFVRVFFGYPFFGCANAVRM